MAELYRRFLGNLRPDPDAGPVDRFEVRLHSSKPITRSNIKLAAGTLAADLAGVEPPLPDGHEADITVATGRDFGHAQSYIVVAALVRKDGPTTNAADLGYTRDGFADKPAR